MSKRSPKSPTTVVSTRVELAAKQAIHAIAKRKGLSAAEAIGEAVTAYIKANGKAKAKADAKASKKVTSDERRRKDNRRGEPKQPE